VVYFLVFLYLISVNDGEVCAVSDLPGNMDFETECADSLLFNWVCNEAGFEFVYDSTVFRSGSRSGRLDFVEPGEYMGNLLKKIPFSYQGEEIVFSGYFRKSLLDEESSSGFYMLLQDSLGNYLEYNYTAIEDSADISEWQRFEIAVRNCNFADSLSFGVYHIGPGSIWIDDFELSVDGKPITEALSRPESAVLADNEYDAGSGIVIGEVSPFQLESLAQLGKVWVFLKYHHPHICRGEVNWDYELFRTMPSVLQASTFEEREQALLGLLDDLSPIEPHECVDINPDEVRLATDLSWIDHSELGVTLASALETVYTGRHQGSSFYVRFTSLPSFFEESYKDMAMPDTGFRLLALYRYWGMIEYYFPYRYATNNIWSDQIRISLPSFIAAGSPLEYQLAVQQLFVSLGDSHASLLVEPEAFAGFLGEYATPLHLYHIDGSWVVDGYTHPSAEESPVRVGDVILSCDRIPLSEIAGKLRPYAHGSNEGSLLNIMGRYLLRGNTNSTLLEISRGNQITEVTMTRVPVEEIDRKYCEVPATGETAYSIMDENISYVHLGTLLRSDVPGLKEAFRETCGLVLDLRNYPCDMPLFDVASYIIPEPTPFVLFSRCDSDNPGSFYWDEPGIAGGGDPDPYTGRVAVIVDEGTASCGEFHAMAWRLAPEARVFGHATCGADGNIVNFYLPGGMYSRFTGLGVYNPDSTETQRVGIIPDVFVNPTVSGLQAGRDELLETAVKWVLSTD